jgi:hypothetical protein
MGNRRTIKSKLDKSNGAKLLAFLVTWKESIKKRSERLEYQERRLGCVEV